MESTDKIDIKLRQYGKEERPYVPAELPDEHNVAGIIVSAVVEYAFPEIGLTYRATLTQHYSYVGAQFEAVTEGFESRPEWMGTARWSGREGFVFDAPKDGERVPMRLAADLARRLKIALNQKDAEIVEEYLDACAAVVSDPHGGDPDARAVSRRSLAERVLRAMRAFAMPAAKEPKTAAIPPVLSPESATECA